MKTNESLIGGRLIDEPRDLRRLRALLRQVHRAYERAGVPIDAVTVQNEPQNRTPERLPGHGHAGRAAGQADRGARPGAAQGAARHEDPRLRPQLVDAPRRRRQTPPGEDPETEYPTDCCSIAAPARWIAGTAFHCYSGDPSRADRRCINAFPGKGIWFTECSGSHGATDPPAKFFADTLKWHARNVVLGVTRNWAKTVVNWNLALDPAGGPHKGGCDTCTGVVTVDPDETVTGNAEYYTLGHLARFVRPGAMRIASTSFGTTGWNGQIMDAAFRNRDGSTALVVHNENDEPRTSPSRRAAQSFDYTLPGGALATFVWKAPRARRRLPRCSTPPLPPGRRPRRPTTTPPRPERRATRSSSTSAACSACAASCSTPAPPRTTQPRDYTLSRARDGVHWSEAARGTATGQLTTIEFPATAARHLRVALTATATVADVRVYR